MTKKKTVREKLRIIIFGADTENGRRFDIALLWLILLSVIIVVIESIPSIGNTYFRIFYIIDWCFTILFSIEYVLRIYSAEHRLKYIFSYWGFIDFLSVSPSYISILTPQYHYLLVIRILRLLRVFRILRLFRFTREGKLLANAIKTSAYKIGVFISFIFIVVVLLGTLMYIVERGNPGFSSIPASIYWGIVTITTVGFGDITPATILGKFLASVMMLAGYAIIAIPTGIVTVELSKGNRKRIRCANCNHSCTPGDNFCSNCGSPVIDSDKL